MFKFLFYGAIILTALYFWGDFRINQVNVRDFLHEYISTSRAKAFVHETQETINSIRELTHQLKELKELQKKQGTQINEALPGLESISADDQKKLMELLNQNMQTQSK